MNLATRIASIALGLASFATPVSAQDLSTYRDFRLGTSLASVAAQTTTNPIDVRSIHRRPAVIDELVWRPRNDAAASRATLADPVEDIVFSFYNDALFRIVVTYGRQRVEGLTDRDIVDSLTAIYGPSTIPDATISSTRLSERYRGDADQVLARWEDAAYSIDLIRPSYESTFALVIYSRSLDLAAKEAIDEALRLDRQEAPAREIEKRKQEDADAEAAADKARRVNRPAFRP